MAMLLAEPEVAEQIKNYTPAQLENYKRILYLDGILTRYTLEQHKKELQAAAGSA